MGPGSTDAQLPGFPFQQGKKEASPPPGHNRGGGNRPVENAHHKKKGSSQGEMKGVLLAYAPEHDWAPNVMWGLDKKKKENEETTPLSTHLS